MIGKITIRHGFAANAFTEQGGFVPFVSDNGKVITNPWSLSGLSREDAEASAEAIAKKTVNRYIGDWEIEIVSIGEIL